MLLDLGLRSKFVVLFVWNIGVFSCPNTYVKDGSKECQFNFFTNGSVCQECPAGYYGTNCSVRCSPPSYGCSCTQQCQCPVCHYIVGCIFTSKSTSSDLEYTAGENTEPHGTMNSQFVSTNMIILLIGVVTTFALLISILYAMRRNCSLEYINGICNRNVGTDSPENESVYHEMNETRTIQN